MAITRSTYSRIKQLTLTISQGIASRERYYVAFLVVTLCEGRRQLRRHRRRCRRGRRGNAQHRLLNRKNIIR